MSNPRDFYDGLAAGYHRMFPDWETSMRRQARVLDGLIGASGQSILDCACGIGTQAVGLAELGHRVTGTDVSPMAVARARREARSRGLRLSAAAADMRGLPFAAAVFDVVVCVDNALCHLLTAADVVAALAEIRRVLRPGGALLASVRDYDRLRVLRPVRTEPQLSTVDKRRTFTFQRWSWHADGERYDFEHFQVSGGDGDWRVERRTSTLWAMTRAELTGLARRAGFGEPRWYSAEALGFHQPVMWASLYCDPQYGYLDYPITESSIIHIWRSTCPPFSPRCWTRPPCSCCSSGCWCSGAWVRWGCDGSPAGRSPPLTPWP